MKIPLREMALRATNRRRDVVMRPIEPTSAQQAALGALYMLVIKAWHTGAREHILPAYSRSLEQSRMTRDDVGDIQIAMSSVDQSAVQAQVEFAGRVRPWATDEQNWHMDKFIGQIKYATNVDLSTMVGVGDTRLTIEQAVARNVALVRDVSDQTRGKIADIVFRGLQVNTSVRDVAKQIAEATNMGRARALRIASDQTVKLSAALDKERQSQVGMTSFEWMHSGKLHYRPHHLARNGKVFEWDSEVAKTDAPGWAPFCGCKARGVLPLANVSAPPRAIPRSMVRPPRRIVPAGQPVRPQVLAPEARNTALDIEQRDYVVRNGRRAGVEFLTAVDQATGEVFGRNVGTKGNVTFTPEFSRAIADPSRDIVAHHNHPSSSSFSKEDIYVLGDRKGLRGLWAHGHDGSSYYAERGRFAVSGKHVDGMHQSLSVTARRILARENRADSQTIADISANFNHIIMLALARKNRLKYTATLSPDRVDAFERIRLLVEMILELV